MLPQTRPDSRPRSEYELFLVRQSAAAVWDLSRAEQVSGLSRALARRRQGGLASAWAALKASHAECFLASGEDIGLVLALLARATGDTRPIYLITHGSFFASPKFRALMWVLRRDPHLVFLPLSGRLGWTLTSEFGVPAGRVLNTSYGVDTRFLDPRLEVHANRARPGRSLVVSAGAANRDYNLLARSVISLGDRVDLRIAAGSSWYPTAVQLDTQERLPHVEINPCPYPELRGLLAAADFVVVPLKAGRHACGYAAIADAMAMGKAVIATKTEHYSDLISEGESGLYVSPNDAEAMTDAIEYLLANPNIAEQMGAAGRRRVESLFSLEAYVGRIENSLSGSVRLRS
jgi:glycosyltransferase involved in cell wall biosynthesis